MEPDTLEARLRALDAGRAAELEMRFSDAGLVLGAGTVLARAGASARDISIDVTEGRLIALLAAAHRRPPAASDLTHLRKAVESWREGEDGLAEMHLALSRLAQLERPISDARRLFLADGLLGAGFEADTLLRALDLEAPLDGGGVSKYSADQPRVPAGSGRTSGEWTSGLGSTSTSPDATSQRASHASRRAAPAQHRPSSTPQTRAPAPPSPSGTGAAMAPAVANAGPAVRQFSIDLPSTIIGAASPPNLGPFGQAVGALADTIEVADSIAKWRELGPRGEALVIEAVEARGWQLLDMHVPIRTALGLRIEDVMVHVPAGTAGNATAYDGFIEVKVNGGRYSSLQQAKDALIGSVGGTLLRQVGDRHAGSRIVLETGLANVRITYAPD